VGGAERGGDTADFGDDANVDETEHLLRSSAEIEDTAVRDRRRVRTFVEVTYSWFMSDSMTSP